MPLWRSLALCRCVLVNFCHFCVIWRWVVGYGGKNKCLAEQLSLNLEVMNSLIIGLPEKPR